MALDCSRCWGQLPVSRDFIQSVLVKGFNLSRAIFAYCTAIQLLDASPMLAVPFDKMLKFPNWPFPAYTSAQCRFQPPVPQKAAVFCSCSPSRSTTVVQPVHSKKTFQSVVEICQHKITAALIASRKVTLSCVSYPFHTLQWDLSIFFGHY